MKTFIEEYGMVVLVLAVIAIMILMVSPLGDMILDGLKGMFSNLTQTAGVEQQTTAKAFETFMI